MSQRILVTGATGAIGKPLSHYLASKGYDLILTSRNSENLETLKKEIVETNKNVSIDFTPSDFSDANSFGPLMEISKRGIKGIVLMPPQLEPTSDCLPAGSVWEAMVKNSFVGPLELVKTLFPILEKNSRSKVVLVSGISSLQVLGHYATSNVLRLMWVAQMKTLAHAFGPKNIHFNTLSLGGVLTDDYLQELTDDAKSENTTIKALLEKEVSNVPLRKYATPQEVAAAIEGLLSPFTDHITGWNIPCDGGFTRAY